MRNPLRELRGKTQSPLIGSLGRVLRTAAAPLAAASVVIAVAGCSSEDRIAVEGASDNPIQPGYVAQASRDLKDGEGMSREFGEANEGAPIPHPFLGWVRPDYAGKYLNISSGERRSYEPAGLTENAPEVWFFGGSALFGFGAQRDEYTIPSAFARAAEDDGVAIRVHNFGVTAHVNYQEVAVLSQLLASGRSPDLVVFHDGYNDRFLHLGAELLGDPGAGHESYVFFSAFVSASQEARGVPITEQGLGRSTGAPVGRDELVDMAAGIMKRGFVLAKTLARGADFDVMFTIQPDLHSKQLVGDEPKVLRAAGYDELMTQSMRELSADFRDRLGGDVIDLSSVFDGFDEPVFVNTVHLNEKGASIVGADLWARARQQLTE